MAFGFRSSAASNRDIASNLLSRPRGIVLDMGRIGSRKHTLLIDDDPSLLRILALQLKHNGFEVETAKNGTEGVDKALRGTYDVIVLDMDLPDRNGLTVCEDLRHNGVLTPILFLSGVTDKKTVVNGLRVGGDDYLEKPFYKAELLERIYALIRRNERLFVSSKLSFGDIVLDVHSQVVQVNHQPLQLTSKEMSLLRCLMQSAPKTVSRNKLFKQVWGINDEHASNRLDAYIKRLRHKLQGLDVSTTIETIYGQGYRLK